MTTTHLVTLGFNIISRPNSPSNGEVFQENENSSSSGRKPSIRRAEFDTLKSQLAKLATDYNTINQGLDQLRGATLQHVKADVELKVLTELHNRVQPINKAVEELRADRAAQGEITMLSRDVQRLAGDYVGKHQFNNLVGRVDLTETTIKTHSQKFSDHPTMEVFESLKQKVNEIEARGVGLAADVKEIDSKVVALDENVKQISSKVTGEGDKPKAVPKAGEHQIAVYVKLVCRTSDNTEVVGGQNIFLFELDDSYAQVATTLKEKIRAIQNKDRVGRVNFSNLNAYWSKKHEVDFIKVVLEPNQWGSSPTEPGSDGIIMDSENCEATLLLLKKADRLCTMHVTIKPCKMEHKMDKETEEEKAKE